MNLTMYQLSYDPLLNNPTPDKLIEFVRSNAYTYQYYVPFWGNVIIKAGASLTQMTESYRPFMSPNLFIISKVDADLMGGALPQQNWDWINAPVPPPLPEQVNAQKN